MMRWILAAVFSLGGFVSLAQADYVIIIANLGLTTEKKEGGMPGKGGGMVGQQGGPGAGNVGMAGAAGNRGGGNFGNQGGFQPGMFGNRGGPGGANFGQAGAAGARGGTPPGGVGGSVPPGGAGGSMPPGGAGGGFGFGGGFQGGLGFQGFGGGTPQVQAPPLLVMTVVELERGKGGSFKADELAALKLGETGKSTFGVLAKHNWGGVVAIYTTRNLHAMVMMAGNRPVPSVSRQFKKLYDARHKVAASAQDLMYLGEWALGHSLLNEFVAVMEELKRLDKEHPAAKAFDKVQAAMAVEIDRNQDAAGKYWQRQLHQNSRESSEHYSLLFNKPPTADTEWKSRLQTMENNYRRFFYWFALKSKDGELAYIPKGKPGLVVPKERMVAVLVGNVRGDRVEFDHFHKTFDGAPLVADSFHARRANLAVFSKDPLDTPYAALKTYFNENYRNFYDRGLLLKGKATKAANNRPKEDFWLAQTLSLVLKSLEADTERAGVSHECTRQLISGIGLLPRGVSAPEWIESGIGSFFEVPRGAAWGGPGSPHWIYLTHYKDWAAKANPKPRDVLNALKSVISDRYFRQAELEKNKDKKAAAMNMARVMSWSLTYYLAQNKLDGLMRYYRELAKLPRDLEFDEDTLILTFARAFDCLEDQRLKGEKPSDVKLGNLANDWHRTLDNTLHEAEGMVNQIRESANELKTGGTGNQGTGGQPDGRGGGIRGGGRGGPAPGGRGAPGGVGPIRGGPIRGQ
jgi:hypothetical protein